MPAASLQRLRFSMRQAKVRLSHLLRTVIYSCDFSLLMIATACEILYFDPSQDADADGWTVLVLVAAFSLVTTYRLTIAFQRYLRVHLPLATVLVSQMISFLIVFVALVPIADFSRRI